MKVLSKVPPQYMLPLEALKGISAKAILAGGALRDLYCGRDPKDIDIFILNEHPVSSYWRYTSVVDGSSPWTSKSYNQVSSAYQIDFVAERSKTVWAAGIMIPALQLIGVCGVKTGIDLIRRFDFGLNQIGIEDGKIIYTDAFIKDWMHQTFTLTHAYTYERSLERYKSWVEKYPNWPIKKSGIVHLHEYYKSYGAKAAKYPLESS